MPGAAASVQAIGCSAPVLLDAEGFTAEKFVYKLGDDGQYYVVSEAGVSATATAFEFGGDFTFPSYWFMQDDSFCNGDRDTWISPPIPC